MSGRGSTGHSPCLNIVHALLFPSLQSPFRLRLRVFLHGPYARREDVPRWKIPLGGVRVLAGAMIIGTGLILAR